MSSNFDINLEMRAVGFDQAWQAMDKLTTATNTMVQSQTGVAEATNKTDKALGASKVTITGLVASLGTVTSSSWNLYSAWESLRKSQLAAQGAQIKVRSSLLAVEAAQKKYNKAVADYGAGSKEAATASEKLAIAQEKLARNQELAALKARDVTEAHAQFITQLPNLVTGVVSSVASFSSLIKEMGGLKGIIPSLISSVSALGTAFRFLFTTPVGLLITGIVTAFTLLATNAFGARDAVNALGKAIGDLLPGARGFLETFGANVNALLNFINPVDEATTATAGLGDAMTTTGETFVLAEAQLRGIDGALVNLSDVIFDVVGAHQSLVTQQTANNAAYEAWKTAITTGNNDVVASYNLTADDIADFEKRYEKEMKDSAKAAKDAADKAYDAWKTSIDKSRQEVEGGFGVLKSSFSNIQSQIASALDEGGKKFKKVLKENGLDPDNPLVLEAVMKWLIDATPAEQGVTGFGLFVAQNIDKMKNGTESTFSSMVQAWVSYIQEEKPKAGQAAAEWGTEMQTKMKEKIASGEPPAQAFLESIRETLDPSSAEQIASLFGIKFPETTKAEFEKGTPAVAKSAEGMTTAVGAKMDKKTAEGFATIFGQGVTVKTVAELDAGKPKAEASATNITTGINTKLGAGMDTIKTTMTTKISEGIVKPLDLAKPQVEKSGNTLVDTFKKVGGQLWDGLVAGWNAAVGAVSGFGQYLKDLLFGGGVKEASAQEMPKTGTTAGPTGKTDYEAEKTALTNFQTFVSQQTAIISAHFVTMKTSIAGTMLQIQTNLGTFSSTALTTVAQAVLSQTSQISVHFITMKTSISGTLLQIQTALGSFVSTVLTTMAKAVLTQTSQISAHFVTMKTSIAGTITQIQGVVSGLSTGIATQAAAISKHTTSVSGSFLAMSQSVAGSTQKVQQASSTMSTTIATHMSSMASHVNSFASSFGSAMSKVASQAKTATSAVKQLQAAVNALKSKSITVHVGLSGPGASFVQHGGSFITGLNPKARPSGQHGFSGMVNTPTTYKGVKMGEGFKPELVTVTPLTRGTGNHGGPTVSSTGNAGGVQVVNVTVVLDGRVIQRFVEKTALAGIGVQI